MSGSSVGALRTAARRPAMREISTFRSDGAALDGRVDEILARGTTVRRASYLAPNDGPFLRGQIVSTHMMEGHSRHVAFIWTVADLLRGDYKQSEYGRVILP